MSAPAGRKKNWERLLGEEFQRTQTMSFVWGENDCCLFALRVIDSIVGSEIQSIFYHKYKTKRGAIRRIVQYGKTLEGAANRIAQEFGGEEIPPGFAQRGDCVMAEVTDTEGELAPALGICYGIGAYFVSQTGLISIPRKAFLKAWRV